MWASMGHPGYLSPREAHEAEDNESPQIIVELQHRLVLRQRKACRSLALASPHAMRRVVLDEHGVFEAKLDHRYL